MGFTSQCAKYFLCFFNFIFFLAGGMALAVGIWLLADRNSFANLISKVDEADVLTKTDAHVIKMLGYILLLIGALTFTVSFMGYCGAMFESRCLLAIYGTLIIIALALECIVVGLALGLRRDAERGTENLLKQTLKYYASNDDKTETVTAAWDGIMTQLRCCGVEGYKDFQQYVNFTDPGMKVPESCCKKHNGEVIDSSCPYAPSFKNSYLQKGCLDEVILTIEDHTGIAIGVALALVALQVLLIFLALYLSCCYWRPQHVLTCWCCC